MSKVCVGRNSMTLVAGLVVVPHLVDLIPWALLGGVPVVPQRLDLIS